jgi:hypothetical protein
MVMNGIPEIPLGGEVVDATFERLVIVVGLASGRVSVRDAGRELDVVGNFLRTLPILFPTLVIAESGAVVPAAVTTLEGSGDGAEGFFVALAGIEADAATSSPAGRAA